ncbi:E3 ubiquitin-protein ligase TRIM56-like [Patella vulgata]|uniref:E3 ubiquitin-protein ligase TRIM56-like n=1 Tax=Patella vulgata TaxID=6465 RepID=UPI00217F8AE1|nr:E3 ubiquitin-protein ligase TRIM56-like [Patella vulgata]
MATVDPDKSVCSICLNDFKQPKIIDCDHTFCFTCLEDYTNKVSSNNRFPCPLCRHDVHIPEGGLGEFKSNLDIDIEQELVSDICTEEIPPCDVCKTGVNSEFKCEDCEQYLCSSCRKMHDALRICHNHVLVPVAETLEIHRERNRKTIPAPRDVCPDHRNKDVRCYCKDCSTAVCSDCFVTNHSSHEFVDLLAKDIDIQTRDELKSLQADIETQIGQFERFCETLTKVKTDIDNSAKTSCEAVDKQVERICSDAKEVGEEIKVKIQKSRDEEIDRTDKLMGEMEVLIEDLKASVKCTVDVIEDKSIVQVLNKIPQVKLEKEDSGLRTLDIPDVKYAWFEQSVIDKTLLRKQLGTLENRIGPTFITRFNFDDVNLQNGENLYSEYHYIQGLPWSIPVRKHDDGGSYLSIFLILNKLAESKVDQCNAKCVISLLNMADKSLCNERTDSKVHQFMNFNDGLGWSKFICWSEISIQSRGFIDRNNNFFVSSTVQIV